MTTQPAVMMINGVRTKLEPKHEKLLAKIEAAGAAVSDEAPAPKIAPTGWRDHLAIHPAAELFPLLSKDEQQELAADIEENGLQEKVAYFMQDGVPYLLDGRNRLDALELLGEQIFVSKYDSSALDFDGIRHKRKARKLAELAAADKDRSSLSCEFFKSAYTDNPFAYVLSANVRRRHLTPEQKRPLTIELVRSSAELSNALLAEMADVDDHEIADVRAELEATSEIPKFEKTIGKDGKKRPARKKSEPRFRPGPSPDQDLSPEERAAKAYTELAIHCRRLLPQMTEAYQQKVRLLVSELTGVKPKARAA